MLLNIPASHSSIKPQNNRFFILFFYSTFFILFWLINPTSYAEENEFFPIPLTQGKTDLTLHPIEKVKVSESQTISFGMPFPKGYLTDISTVKVFDESNIEIPIFVKVISPWRNISTATDEGSVRSLLVQINITYKDQNNDGVVDNIPLTIEWGGSTRTINDLQEINTRSSWHLVESALYSFNEKVFEPPVFAVFSAQWYGLSVLKTRLLPKSSHPDFSTYEEFFVQFTNTALNKVDPRVSSEYLNNYTSAYASWLFDRAMTIYQVALKTGDYNLLREAHRASQFFSNHINSQGYFDLKSNNDVKYSHAEGLATNYWLTGDEGIKSKIAQMVNAFDGFNVNYSLSTNFWTERHAATVLSGFVVAYEVLGYSELAIKAKETFSSLYQMQNAPQNGIPNTGGLMHTANSHGGGGEDFVSSPWMSSLLIDAVERYYIHSSDQRVKNFVYRLADYTAEIGTYSTDVFLKDNLPAYKIPYYIAGETLTDIQKDFDPWTNIEHSLDVSKIFALAHFLKKHETPTSPEYLTYFSDLFKTAMEVNLPNWIRSGAPSLELGEFKGGNSAFRLSPPRKYSWWFRTTANIDWLIGEDTHFISSNDVNNTHETNAIVDVTISSNVEVAEEGDIVEFTLSYHNIGEQDAVSAILINKIFTNHDYFEILPESISHSGTYTNNIIYWSLGSINKQDSVQQVSYKIRVLKPNESFSLERPSASIISQASVRYGNVNSTDDIITPSTNIWDLGKYTHSRLSNTAVVPTINFNDKIDEIDLVKTIILNEDTSINLLLADIFPEVEIQQYKVSKNPYNGTASGIFPELIYTPNNDFFGADTIELIFNEESTPTRGLLVFNTAPINDVPVASAISITGLKNSNINIELIGIDADDDLLTFSFSSLPSNGSVVLDGSSVTYKPNQDFIGTDYFSYQVYDGKSYVQGSVNIIVDNYPGIKNYINQMLADGKLSSWVSFSLLERVSLFEKELIIIEELQNDQNSTHLQILMAKHKANVILLSSNSYLKTVTDEQVTSSVASQIRELLSETLSSENITVYEFSQYLYTHFETADAHTYPLSEATRYLILFDYYFKQSKLDPQGNGLSNAFNTLNKAELFIRTYVNLDEENLVYQTIFQYFNVTLRQLLNDNNLNDSNLNDSDDNLKGFVTEAIEDGRLSKWVGASLLGKIELFESQLLTVNELSLSSNTKAIELLKAKHTANMYLIASHSYLNYVSNDTTREKVTNMIQRLLLDAIASDKKEIIDLSELLYQQMRDSTGHSYVLSLSKEHLIYIDYFLRKNDVLSARITFDKIQKTLAYYISQPHGVVFNETYRKIYEQYQKNIKPLIY